MDGGWSIVRVPFRGRHIEAIGNVETGIWVSVKRVCEHVGLSCSAQVKKLKDAAWATVAMIATVDASGRNYEMFCIRADCIAKWMSEISSRNSWIGFQYQGARAPDV